MNLFMVVDELKSICCNFSCKKLWIVEKKLWVYMKVINS